MREHNNFQHLAAHIEKEAAQKRERATFFIKNGYLPDWGKHTIDPDRGLKEYLTARRWEQYRAGEITREQAEQYATRRRFKEIDAETIKKQDKLLKVREAAPARHVAISVTWKRSQTWGYNPHATVTVDGVTQYHGTASGCGYDKQSAAVGGALNQSDAVLKALYLAKEKALAKAPAKIRNNPDTPNGDLIYYGAGYGVLPYFEGGVGMSAFERIFNACGYTLTHQNHDDKSDYYFFEVMAK